MTEKYELDIETDAGELISFTLLKSKRGKIKILMDKGKSLPDDFDLDELEQLVRTHLGGTLMA